MAEDAVRVVVEAVRDEKPVLAGAVERRKRRVRAHPRHAGVVNADIDGGVAVAPDPVLVDERDVGEEDVLHRPGILREEVGLHRALEDDVDERGVAQSQAEEPLALAVVARDVVEDHVVDPVRLFGVGLVEVGVRAGRTGVDVGGGAVDDELVGAGPDVGGDLADLVAADEPRVGAVVQFGREAAGDVADVAVAEDVGVGAPAPLAVVALAVVQPDDVVAVLAVEDADVVRGGVAVERDALEAQALRAGTALGDLDVFARDARGGRDCRPVGAGGSRVDAAAGVFAGLEEDRAANGDARDGGLEGEERGGLGAFGVVIAVCGIDPERVGDGEQTAVVREERQIGEVVCLRRRALRDGAGAERDRSVGDERRVDGEDVFPDAGAGIEGRRVGNVGDFAVEGELDGDAVLVEGADAGAEEARDALVGDDVPAGDGARGAGSSRGQRSSKYEVRSTKHEGNAVHKSCLAGCGHDAYEGCIAAAMAGRLEMANSGRLSRPLGSRRRPASEVRTESCGENRSW